MESSLTIIRTIEELMGSAGQFFNTAARKSRSFRFLWDY
jgi:hypothetical protein